MNSETPSASEERFRETVRLAYERTRQAFESRSGDPAYIPFVIPVATRPRVGFAIFYTPPSIQPRLLIIGQNPSDFSGLRDLSASPNAEMLAGRPPTVNSYIVHSHDFARALQVGFAKFPELLNACVGLNVWHFQSTSCATNAPALLRRFCEATTLELLDAMSPSHVLCFGLEAYKAVAPGGVPVQGALKALRCDSTGSTFWYVPHLTGSWSRRDAEHDLPLVLKAIATEQSV